ncbi:MAG: 2-amino-4-hydroxy-6-hydroxymethyldihydropteridine diphosphokinase [Pseudomonadota bacterium]
MKTAYLGLGGNMGDVREAMAAALDSLHGHQQMTVTMVSPLYKTPPWGVVDQPWFLNCCAAVQTSLSPEDLLLQCQRAEHEGKRQRNLRWGPRTIDIDVLAYEGVEQDTETLTIPHPRMTARAFVMVPLADIAPDLLVAGKTANAWLETLDTSELQVADTADWWPL